MKRLTPLLCMFISTTAMAQDHVALEYRGQPGVWFPLAEARAALQLRTEVPQLEERLRLTSEALTLAESELANVRRALDLSQMEGTHLQEALDASQAAHVGAEQALLTTEARAYAWWRHPGLWFGVGAVIGVVLAVVLAVSL